MADDIVTLIHKEIAKQTTLGQSLALLRVADEIERLRSLCNDLYHDATCDDSFCRLCGEGIKEWEARHG